MEPLDFDGYVDVLRQRLFDYEGVHGTTTTPDFAVLMSDHAYAPEAWAVQAYEELLAQGHLNPNLSGMTMGPHAHGLLSADGRYYIRQQQQERLEPPGASTDDQRGRAATSSKERKRAGTDCRSVPRSWP